MINFFRFQKQFFLREEQIIVQILIPITILENSYGNH